MAAYRHEVLVAFWMSIHLMQLDCAQKILTLDKMLEQIVKNLRKNGAYILERYRKKEEEERRKLLMRGVNIAATNKERDIPASDSFNSQEINSNEKRKSKMVNLTQRSSSNEGSLKKKQKLTGTIDT